MDGLSFGLAIVDVIQRLRQLGDVSDAGPFDGPTYDANVAAGAGWEARQGVRKALRRLEAGGQADALGTLDRLLARLPAGPARDQVADLAARLRAATAADGSPADGNSVPPTA